METPTLETPRLLLRPITEADIEFIHRLFSRPETNKYSSYDDLQSLGEAKKMYESYLKPGFIDHFRISSRETQRLQSLDESGASGVKLLNPPSPYPTT
jgi:RimJ/RimL family protein N-acetyltransferase